MYKSGDLKRQQGDWPQIDDSREDYRDLAIGDVYLPHSCGEWVIGGIEQVKELMADLQTILDE